MDTSKYLERKASERGLPGLVTENTRAGKEDMKIANGF